MGASSKRSKEKDSRKRRRSGSGTERDSSRERRHKHHHRHHHHRDYKAPKTIHVESDNDSDVVEIIEESPPFNRFDAPSNAVASSEGADSLSISETNRLRAKLGLKPLEVSSASNHTSTTSATASSKSVSNTDKRIYKDDWGEFEHRPAENWADKVEQEKLRERIALQREKRELEKRMIAAASSTSKSHRSHDYKTADDEVDDVRSWVMRNRHVVNAKRQAEQRAKMLEELDDHMQQAPVASASRSSTVPPAYTAKDLKGLKVDHDVDSLAVERDIVLTLKDQDVLADDASDVLVNVNIVDNERYDRNVRNKKIKAVYNPYEDQEYDEFGQPKEKSLLAQYDEEIYGKQKESFELGVDVKANMCKALEMERIKAKLAQKKIESIKPITELRIASDYYNEEELTKFKKPKRKVRERKIRTKGKLTADELEQTAPSVEQQHSGGQKHQHHRSHDRRNHPGFDNTIDDVGMNGPIDYDIDLKIEDEKEELVERALHRSRTVKQRENMVLSLLKSEEMIKEEMKQEHDVDDEANIIFDSTAEFCRILGDIPTYGKSGNREENFESNMDIDSLKSDRNFGDAKMDERDSSDDDDDEDDDDDDDVQFIDPDDPDSRGESSSRWKSLDASRNHDSVTGSSSSSNKKATTSLHEVQILDEEPNLNKGMAAALKLAMSKGYLDKGQAARPSNSRLAHLQAKHYSIEDKNYTDDNERGGGGGGRRERYAGPITDFREKDSFKPNVKLEYIDDDGHLLNSKEAFRYLSHKFHGKGPGKNKIEKRIKKSVQEQLMMKMSSTDTPLGTLNMLQAKQKETQLPFVVLSGSKQYQSTPVIAKNRR